jgi:hypothetical protein
VAAALTAIALPAQAAWHSYAAQGSGVLVRSTRRRQNGQGDLQSAAGQRAATMFRSLDDNIEYKVTVVDFANRANDEASPYQRSRNLSQNNKKVLADAEARVEQSYGRKMSFDLPNNGGRSMAAVYISRGHLIQLEVTVLPANGDYASPDLGRFIDSIAFNSGSSDPGKVELQLAK